MATLNPTATTELTGQGPTADPYLALVWSGGGMIRPLPGAGKITLGRGEGADVVVPDPSVSRLHATVVVGDEIRLIDHGSANGTWVGGTRLAPEVPHPLAPTAVFEIGKVLVTLDARVAPPARTSFIWNDPITLRIRRLASAAAKTSLPVLIGGERGVGKKALARFIHDESNRAQGPLVWVACGQPDLAGKRRSIFDEARAGTVVFELVEKLPKDAQDLVLRALAPRETPRGSGARCIFTTEIDLEAHVQRGRLRRDLYAEIRGVSFVLPPLARRGGDIIAIAQAFLEEAARESGRDAPALTEEARSALVEHAWPGNVPELRDAVRRLSVTGATACGAREVRSALGLELADAPLADPRDAERARILAALEQCRHNQTRAAALLGMTRRALVYRLEEMDLPRPRKRPPPEPT